MKSESREHQKCKVQVMSAEDIKCGMDGIPPTADEAQVLHFFYGTENQTREGEIGEARKTHDRAKEKDKESRS
jgi:hypothetical protein